MLLHFSINEVEFKDPWLTFSSDLEWEVDSWCSARLLIMLVVVFETGELMSFKELMLTGLFWFTHWTPIWISIGSPQAEFLMCCPCPEAVGIAAVGYWVGSGTTYGVGIIEKPGVGATGEKYGGYGQIEYMSEISSFRKRFHVFKDTHLGWRGSPIELVPWSWEELVDRLKNCWVESLSDFCCSFRGFSCLLNKKL